MRPVWVVLLTVASLGALAHQALASEAKGLTEIWHYERIVDSIVVDSGEIETARDEITVLRRASSVSGELVFQVTGSAVKALWDETTGEEIRPESPWPPEQLRFRTQLPLAGSGVLTVAQHTPGETWRFTFGGQTITKLEPVDHRPINFRAQVFIGEKMEMGMYESIPVMPGEWLSLGVGKTPLRTINYLVYGAPGADEAEMYPNAEGRPFDFGAFRWVDLELPPELGRFFGLALAPGARWVVEVNGQRFEAVSEEVDPEWAYEQRRID